MCVTSFMDRPLLGADGCVTFHTHTYDLPSSSPELCADSIIEGCENACLTVDLNYSGFDLKICQSCV